MANAKFTFPVSTTTVSNVAAGTAPTDAVNVSQLNAATSPQYADTLGGSIATIASLSPAGTNTLVVTGDVTAAILPNDYIGLSSDSPLIVYKVLSVNFATPTTNIVLTQSLVNDAPTTAYVAKTLRSQYTDVVAGTGINLQVNNTTLAISATPQAAGVSTLNTLNGDLNITAGAGIAVSAPAGGKAIQITNTGTGGGGTTGQATAFNVGPVNYANLTYSVGGTGVNPTEQINEGTIYIGTGTAYSTNNAVVLPGTTTQGYQFFNTQVGSVSSDFVAGMQVITIGVSGTSNAARTALQIVNGGLPYFRRLNSWYDTNPQTGIAFTVSGTTMTITYNIDAASIATTDLAPWVGCAVQLSAAGVYGGYYQVKTVNVVGRNATITLTVATGGPASGTCTLFVFSSQFPGYIGFTNTPTRSDLTPQAAVTATGEYQVPNNRNISFTFGTPFQFNGLWYVFVSTTTAVTNFATAGTFDFNNPIAIGGINFSSLVVDAVTSATGFNLRIPAGFSSAPTVVVPSGTTTSVWNNGDVPSFTSFGPTSTSTPGGFIRVTVQPNSWTANSLSGAFNTATGFFLPDNSANAGTFAVCWDVFCALGINVNSLGYTNSATNWNNRHAFNAVAGGNLNTPSLQAVNNVGNTISNSGTNVGSIVFNDSVSGSATIISGTQLESRLLQIDASGIGNVKINAPATTTSYTLTLPNAAATAQSFVEVDSTGQLSFKSVQSEIEAGIVADLGVVRVDGLQGTLPVAIANSSVFATNVTGLVWSGSNFATGQCNAPINFVAVGQTGTGNMVLNLGQRTLIVGFSGNQLALNSFQMTSLSTSDATATFPPATTTATTIYTAQNCAAGSIYLPNTGTVPKGLGTYVRDSNTIQWTPSATEPNTFTANVTSGSGIAVDTVAPVITTFSTTALYPAGTTTLVLNATGFINNSIIQFSATPKDYLYRVTAVTGTSITISPALVVAVPLGTFIYNFPTPTKTSLTDFYPGQNINVVDLGNGQQQISATSGAVNFGGQPINSIAVQPPLSGTYNAGALTIASQNVLSYLTSASTATNTPSVSSLATQPSTVPILSGFAIIDGYQTKAGDSVLFKDLGTNTTASWTASVTAGSNVMTVGSVTTGVIQNPMIVSNANVLANTYIVRQLTGTYGGIGTYQLSQTQTAGSSGNYTGANGTLTAANFGLYSVAAGLWTRRADAQTAAQLRNAVVFSANGTQTGSNSYAQINGNLSVINTDPQVWVAFSLNGASSLAAVLGVGNIAPTSVSNITLNSDATTNFQVVTTTLGATTNASAISFGGTLFGADAAGTFYLPNQTLIGTASTNSLQFNGGAGSGVATVIRTVPGIAGTNVPLQLLQGGSAPLIVTNNTAVSGGGGYAAIQLQPSMTSLGNVVISPVSTITTNAIGVSINGQSTAAISLAAQLANYVQVAPAAAGASPQISAAGSDATVALSLAGKNAPVQLSTNFANFITATGAANGNSPVLAAAGTTDANVILTLNSKGTSPVYIAANSANYLSVSGSATTNPIALNATGSDANIGWNANAKGNASLILGNVNNGLQIAATANTSVTLSPNTAQQTLTTSQLRLAGLGSSLATSQIVLGSNFPTQLTVTGSGSVVSPAQNAKVTLTPLAGGTYSTIDVILQTLGAGNLLFNTAQCGLSIQGNALGNLVLQAASTTQTNCGVLVSPQASGGLITLGYVDASTAQWQLSATASQLIETAVGGGTNIDRLIGAKGTGVTILSAHLANNVSAVGANAGSRPTLMAAGSDAVVDLALSGKSTGVIYGLSQIQAANGLSMNSGTAAAPAYLAPLIAANSILTAPSTVTAGTGGQALRSRGAGQSPGWSDNVLYSIIRISADTLVSAATTTNIPLALDTAQNGLGLAISTTNTNQVTGLTSTSYYRVTLVVRMISSQQGNNTWHDFANGSSITSDPVYGSGVVLYLNQTVASDNESNSITGFASGTTSLRWISYGSSALTLKASGSYAIIELLK